MTIKSFMGAMYFDSYVWQMTKYLELIHISHLSNVIEPSVTTSLPKTETFHYKTNECRINNIQTMEWVISTFFYVLLMIVMSVIADYFLKVFALSWNK